MLDLCVASSAAVENRRRSWLMPIMMLMFCQSGAVEAEGPPCEVEVMSNGADHLAWPPKCSINHTPEVYIYLPLYLSGRLTSLYEYLYGMLSYTHDCLYGKLAGPHDHMCGMLLFTHNYLHGILMYLAYCLHGPDIRRECIALLFQCSHLDSRPLLGHLRHSSQPSTTLSLRFLPECPQSCPS